MPTISSSINPWHRLPSVAMDHVGTFLPVRDLDALSRAYDSARDAILPGTFDRACRDWIEQAERVFPCELPAIEGTRFVGRARELADSGHAHAALLVNLHTMRGRLAELPTVTPRHDSHAVGGLWRHGTSGCFRTPSGEITFAGDSTHGIAFCSPKGPGPTPPALEVAQLCDGNRIGLWTVHGAPPSPGAATLVVRCADQRMALFTPGSGEIDRLPESFEASADDVIATTSISANGRYVAAQLWDNRLLVYDAHARRMVVDLEDGSECTSGFSVDSEGNVIVGAHVDSEANDAEEYRGLQFSPERQRWEPLVAPLGVHAGWLALSPNERYFVKRQGPQRNLFLVDRLDPHDPGIELRANRWAEGELGATAVAFSRANVAVAALYPDNHLRVFDLLEGTRTIDPKCILALPGSARGRYPSLSFSPDGTALDVVYQTGGTVEFLRYALV